LTSSFSPSLSLDLQSHTIDGRLTACPMEASERERERSIRCGAWMEDQERRTRSPYLYSRGLPVPVGSGHSRDLIVLLLLSCCFMGRYFLSLEKIQSFSRKNTIVKKEPGRKNIWNTQDMSNLFVYRERLLGWTSKPVHATTQY
jgi:hypothetical protein